VKLYTRTGDAGETSLFGGTRARKDDPRVDAYGEVDELNAWLGLARASAIDPESRRNCNTFSAISSPLAPSSPIRRTGSPPGSRKPRSRTTTWRGSSG
jgi:hypothetical protein